MDSLISTTNLEPTKREGLTGVVFIYNGVRLLCLWVLVGCLCGGAVGQAAEPWQIGGYITSGIAWQSRPYAMEGMESKIPIQVSPGIAIAVPLASKWRIMSGLQVDYSTYRYSLSHSMQRSIIGIREGGPDFWTNQTYLTVPVVLTLQLTDASNPGRFLLGGAQYSYRVAESHNFWELIQGYEGLGGLVEPAFLLRRSEVRYYQHQFGVIGGVGYAWALTSSLQGKITILGFVGSPVLKGEDPIFGQFRDGYTEGILLRLAGWYSWRRKRRS